MVLFLMKSCFGLFYIKMTHLSAEDLAWINAAKRYPVVHFESPEGRKAKLVITEIYKHNDSNPFYISSNSKSYYYANAGYLFDLRDDSAKIDGRLQITLLDSLVYNSRFGGRYDDNDHPVKLKSFIINDKKIENCIIVDPSTSRLSTNRPENPIESFVISKDYGLIYYRFADGEEFFRKFAE